MRATYLGAEQRYDQFRRLALEYAQDDLSARNINNLRLSTITAEALAVSKLWDRSVTRRVDWDWVDGYGAFKFRHPKRFEIAVWQQKNLITLSMGRPTYHGSALRLDFVEARPRDLGDRPSTFKEVLLAYGVYARMINASQIRIMNPINDDIKGYYEAFGYTYVRRGDYLYREIPVHA